MTKIKYSKLFLLPLFILMSFVIVSCGESEGSEKENQQTEDKSKAVNVQTVELKGTEYIDYINVIGTLKPFEKANLSYQSGGIIKKILKDKGDRVAEGDTILIIDNDVLKANLDGAKANFELAEVTYQKQAEIYKSKVNSEYQLLESKFRRDQAKANYDLMKAQYAQTFITAPFAGIVDAKYYEEGEMAVPGMPIVNLINASKIKIEAGVPERYVGQIYIGRSAKVVIKSISSQPVYGKVIYVGSSVISENRTFPVELIIDNGNGKLKPELVADIFLETDRYENVVTVPDEVVSRTDNGYTVYVANNGIAESRIIEILNRSRDKIAVKSGLQEGEQLIVVGYQNLINGQKINTVN
ncbi:MAG: efflux RND transporter periplasmic adaptor subunit [Bacteroidetes bacterium]|nr:efflux RND transporter periplasmic adaptor subunit [Bacteroidota bacterium]